MTAMTLTEVPLETLGLDRFADVIGIQRLDALCEAAERARPVMEGRTFWNLNSTAKGGGVAEMLASQLPYARGVGIDTRWLVIDGTPDFFAVSKRIHNLLHDNAGDGEPLDDAARAIYESNLAHYHDELLTLVQPGDVVLFHDPQTAGLVPVAKARGAFVVWRCHVGVDEAGERARSAWNFLRPYVEQADACIFTRREHVWEGLDPDRVVIMPPSIDAFTPKNQPLDASTAAAILVSTGITYAPGGDESPSSAPQYVNRMGERQTVAMNALVQPAPLPADAPMVLQVSRWDALKDPVGVLRGFADHVARSFSDAHLVLAGPAADAVADDPEQIELLEEVKTAWRALEPSLQERVHLVSLPMDDEDENAAVVNALQRHATIVVQKSLAEGFGLTVAEAMWKCKPVVASARGGIIEQITDGETGVLLDDPTDPAELGAALRGLLADPVNAARLGEAAHERVCEQFLTPRELRQQFELLGQLVSASA